ncbi:sensor histidine kinase [Rhizobium sp. G187]|uniref:sensor histidine kinase n=1 Tax=Rhizobium sp. G187 TaxID=3451352 RepID=UPI003EE71561
MADLIRSHDWSTTLGPPDAWPAALKAALSICLSSSFPTAIYWGPDLILIYNDAWAPIPGERHPWALGRPASEVWFDIWEVVGPQFEQVQQTGQGVSRFDELLPMLRNGVVEETYWNYSFTAIRDESDRIVGVFNQGNETTAAVIARRKAQEENARLGRMFAEAPAAIAITEGKDHVFTLANPAYLDLIGRDEVLQRTVAETLPELVGQGFIELLDQVFETGKPHIGRAVPIRLAREGTAPELRYVDFVYQPISNAEGGSRGIFVQATDVTDATTALVALRESEQRFEAIVNSIDQMIWSTTADGYHDYFNERWYEFTGVPRGSTDGADWANVFHPEDQPRTWDTWRKSLETGAPYEVEYRLRHHTGAYRWVIGRAQCVRDDDGDITRWYGTCTDIHDLKVAEEARQLLLKELNHRVKNLFAVTSGMVSMTARNSATVAGMATSLQGRLQALAKAHELVQPVISNDTTSREALHLAALLQELISPHIDPASDRVSMAGPDILVGPKASASLALIFHELATNASKYGAFREPDGRLDVRWAEDGAELRVSWVEDLGHAAMKAPNSEGFGSKLARMSATHQLGGSIAFDWQPTGLTIALILSAAHLEQ